MCRLFGAVSHGPVYYALFEGFAAPAATRRAPPGTPIGPEWSHPFVDSKAGRTWAFAHNGGLNDCPFREEDGRIDSQVAFRLLLSNLDGSGPQEVAAATKATVNTVRRGHGGG